MRVQLNGAEELLLNVIVKLLFFLMYSICVNAIPDLGLCINKRQLKATSCNISATATKIKYRDVFYHIFIDYIYC